MSSARTRSAAVLTAGVWAVLFLVRSELFAQTVARQTDGTVSLRAAGVPLGQVMHAVNVVFPFEVLKIDSKVESREVTLDLDHVTVQEALIAILAAAQVDYALVGTRRLVAGDIAFLGSARSDMTRPGPVAQRSSDGSEGREIPEPVWTTDDQIRAELQTRELENALSMPRQITTPGSVMTLPFPGPDGNPITIIKPSGSAASPLPFPAAPAPPVVPQSSQLPAFISLQDPQLQQLIDTLAPGPGQFD